MKKNIEIYVRNSSRHNFLMFHMGKSKKKTLIKGFDSGDIDSKDVEINVEMNILPEWITDLEQRELFEENIFGLHVRIPVSKITVSYSEDDE